MAQYTKKYQQQLLHIDRGAEVNRNLFHKEFKIYNAKIQIVELQYLYGCVTSLSKQKKS